MIKLLNFKELNLVLTRREIETINKKLAGKSLNQQDSNYLSRFVRPRLKQIIKFNAGHLLNQIEYNQKTRMIESNIIRILSEELEGIKAVILFGSIVQNNYKDYNDIDCITIVEKPFWEKLHEKYKKINKIKKNFEKQGINLDLEIYDKVTFNDFRDSNISLIYQLKDSKVIYGKIDIPNKYEIGKLDLRMKLDYSIFEDSEYKDVKGKEIYESIRNIILVRLLMKGIIDNQKLHECTYDEIGKNLAMRLKINQESPIEKKIAILQLKRLVEVAYQELNDLKWEKIELCSL